MGAVGALDWRGTDFSDTAASKSARLLSILKRSFKAREKDFAIVLLFEYTVSRGTRLVGIGEGGISRLRAITWLPFSFKVCVGHGGILDIRRK